MTCPACGDEHKSTRIKAAGLDVIVCDRVPSGVVYAIQPGNVHRFPVSTRPCKTCGAPCPYPVDIYCSGACWREDNRLDEHDDDGER